MIKELTLPLGALEVPELAAGQVLATGWYVDRTTGQYYYYDAISGQWYYYAAGYIYALVTWQPSPSPKLYFVVGEKLRVRFSFKYRGPEIKQKEFRAEIGKSTPGKSFDPFSGGIVDKKIDIPRCDTATTLSLPDYFIDIVIPSGAQGQTIGAYCKWNQLTYTEGVSGTVCYYDVAEVAAAEGEFDEFKITKFEKVQ